MRTHSFFVVTASSTLAMLSLYTSSQVRLAARAIHELVHLRDQASVLCIEPTIIILSIDQFGIEFVDRALALLLLTLELLAQRFSLL